MPFVRRQFCHLPTPLEALPSLSRHLGGPAIYVKRDDCTGLSLGGNKGRKLEYIIAEALAQGADTVVTAGGVQSNHCRYTAAAAARHGLKCELILSRQVPNRQAQYEISGNVLLDGMFGAKIRFIGSNIEWSDELAKVAQELRSINRRPYVIPLGGSSPTGTLGYVACAHELKLQLESAEIKPDALIVASGTGGTQAGLMVGLASCGWPQFGIIGASVAKAAKEQTEVVMDLAAKTRELLRMSDIGSAALPEVDDRFIGEGYGIPANDTLEAIDLCARLEGLLLDPVYTGKAMACLIDRIRDRRFVSSQKVIFVHTGGVPALWAYQDEIANYLTAGENGVT